MNLEEMNPYVRYAEVQPAILEGPGLRFARDSRLFYGLDREAVLITENREIRMTADTLVYIPSGVRYYFRGKLRVAVVNFDPSRANRIQFPNILPMNFDSPDWISDTPEELSELILLNGDAGFRENFLRLVADFHFGDPLSDMAASALVKTVLAEMIRRMRSPVGGEEQLADRLRSYIRLHATEIGSNEEIGAYFSYHPVYLGEVYRRCTGMTLHQAVLRERIRLACRLLALTDSGIQQIAFDTGFSSRSHFCTAFRQVMGMTPGEYRSDRNRENF